MKSKKGFIAGLAIGLALTFCVTFGAAIWCDIEVAYNNVKIKIDNEYLTPRDVNGRVVEPFISEGTTYLPLRAVAQGINKYVDWNDETKTVEISTMYHTPDFSSADKTTWNKTAKELLAQYLWNTGVYLDSIDNISDIKYEEEVLSFNALYKYREEWTSGEKMSDANRFNFTILEANNIGTHCLLTRIESFDDVSGVN